ncbi:DUF6491 family protein [Cognatilysobacter segetis]|uniref:DUF6491 family protein n=1 Tax=Cognatilysobacter segetis TaxID=2492394 RepID=UPI00105DE436|nr:DUF6491 family protein [Lysobacter segetis]
MRTPLLATLLAATALAGGCASDSAARTADRLALYRAHAGPPVSDFPYYRTFTEWTPLGRDALAVWLSPTRAYLLDTPDCNDLEWAHGIQISDTNGRVSARFDRVQPLGVGSVPISCRIEQIRPLDTKAIRDAERMPRAERR